MATEYDLNLKVVNYIKNHYHDCFFISSLGKNCYNKRNQSLYRTGTPEICLITKKKFCLFSNPNYN